MTALRGCLAAAVTILWASQAVAAIEVIDFRGAAGQQNSLTFNLNNGQSVKVTGFLQSGQQVDVFQGSWGLGVVNPNDANDASFFGGHTVDAKNGAEYIQFEFSAPTQIKDVFFAEAWTFDTFALSVDGQPIDVTSFSGLNTDFITQLPPNGPGVNFPNSLPFGSTWTLFANNYSGGKFDQWKVEKMRVDIIPEPGALLVWSFMGLSAGVVIWRRRRKAAVETA